MGTGGYFLQAEPPGTVRHGDKGRTGYVAEHVRKGFTSGFDLAFDRSRGQQGIHAHVDRLVGIANAGNQHRRDALALFAENGVQARLHPGQGITPLGIGARQGRGRRELADGSLIGGAGGPGENLGAGDGRAVRIDESAVQSLPRRRLGRAAFAPGKPLRGNQHGQGSANSDDGLQNVAMDHGCSFFFAEMDRDWNFDKGNSWMFNW